MTESELTDLESTLAQCRATVRTVGNTATMQAASEELHSVAAGLVAEVRRLNGLIEQSRQVFTWNSRNGSEWVLYSDGRWVGYLHSTNVQRGKVWGHADFSGYFDTLDEARAWVETRLRDSGVIKPIDVVEVDQ